MENLEQEPATTGDRDIDGHCAYGPLKEEPEPDLAATDGDGGVDDDYASNIGVDGYYDSSNEEPKPKPSGDGVANDVDSYCNYGLFKKESEPELATTDSDGGDGGAEDGYACYTGIYKFPKKEPKLGGGADGAVDVNGYYDCDQPKDEPEFVDFHNFPLKEEAKPELATASDDAVAEGGRDFGYDCSHCGISLSTQEFRVEHELRCKIHMEQKELESQVTKLYHCGYCRCPFLNKELKDQHQWKYCQKRPGLAKSRFNGTYFACDKCEYVTKRKNCLEKHLLNHNKNNAEWFACTQCSYKTVHKHTLTSHMKIHSNIFSCCCPICGKSFRKKLNLDDHLLRRHSDESDVVEKLITHKVHTCTICNKFQTVRKNDFDQHLAITHNKGVGCQKYECPHCPYSTFHKGHLTKHSKRHAEKKDYLCTVCKKQFLLKHELDSHVLYNHADDIDLVKTITSKIHRCKLCSFKTVVTSHLKWHVQSKHI